MTVTLTIILAEICLVLMAVITVIGVKALIRRRRDQAAINTLVTSIKTNQPARVEKLAGALKDSGQLSDDDALAKANELIKKQNKFYQDAIDLYFTRNHEILSKLDSRMEELLSQYQGLFAGGGGDAASMDNAAMEELSKGIASLSREIEELRNENANLTSQLKAAEHELDQLGQEYVSAFNKPKTDKKLEAATTLEDDTKQPDSAASNEAEAGGEVEMTSSPEIGQETETETEAEKNLEVEVETKSEVETEAMPAADEAVAQRSDIPEPEAEQADDKPTNTGSLSAADDTEEDQGLLTDLDLAELLGDQPAQPASNDKTADNK